jgi:hypothetical protein
MFSVGSVPRNYKTVRSGELKKYEAVVEFSSVQLEVRIVPVEYPVGS